MKKVNFLLVLIANDGQYILRKKPRRIIMGLVVNHELHITEVRFKQLAKVVDVFVFLESRVTTGKLWSPMGLGIVIQLMQ